MNDLRAPVPAWPPGNGEMVQRIRVHNWAVTPLGPVEDWPQSLRTAVDMVLAMPGPATILWGPAGVQIYNDAYVAIAKDRHPALLGRPAVEGWPDAYTEMIAPLLDAARAGRATQLADFLVTLHTPDGGWEECVFDIAWSPIRDERGAVTGALQMLADVTDRHRAEKAQRESEVRFRQFANASCDLLWVRDAETLQWEYLSPAFESIYGLSSAEALAGDTMRNWAELIHPEDREKALASIARVRDGERVTFEYRIRRPADGRARWLRNTDFPMRDTAGRIVRIGGIGQDVTELKAAEAALLTLNEGLEHRVEARTAELMSTEATLRQVQKMEAVGQLTGGIAHDFNNMLQAIAGSLDLMHRRIGQGRIEEVERYLEGARRTIDRAAALTHRLLAFARRQALQPRPVNPDELVEDMAELIRRTVGPGVAVELRLGDGTWPIQCDPNQLENALLNLCINARDAMPEGGRLAIATRHVRLSAADVADQEGAAPGEYVELAVTDTGSGMDETTRERVFEPFFTTKPFGQGTGLGLSQLYGFVRQSYGVVRLDSEPGHGTTVRLYLPRHGQVSTSDIEVSGPEEDTELEAAGINASVGIGTVLLVEDEAGVRAVVAEHVRELGYTVVEAGDGPAALRALEGSLGTRVDLLVTDVGLPNGLNGRQVADAARERRPGLPVLFITGFAGAALEGQLALGMAVIGKPFTLDALAAKVRIMVEGEGST